MDCAKCKAVDHVLGSDGYTFYCTAGTARKRIKNMQKTPRFCPLNQLEKLKFKYKQLSQAYESLVDCG